jgi:hypothetical protein
MDFCLIPCGCSILVVRDWGSFGEKIMAWESGTIICIGKLLLFVTLQHKASRKSHYSGHAIAVTNMHTLQKRNF